MFILEMTNVWKQKISLHGLGFYSNGTALREGVTGIGG